MRFILARPPHNRQARVALLWVEPEMHMIFIVPQPMLNRG